MALFRQRYASAWRGYESICHGASILLVRPCNVPVYLSSTDPSVPDRVRQFANLSLTGSSLSLYSSEVFTRFLGRFCHLCHCAPNSILFPVQTLKQPLPSFLPPLPPLSPTSTPHP